MFRSRETEHSTPPPDVARHIVAIIKREEPIRPHKRRLQRQNPRQSPSFTNLLWFMEQSTTAQLLSLLRAGQITVEELLPFTSDKWPAAIARHAKEAIEEFSKPATEASARPVQQSSRPPIELVYRTAEPGVPTGRHARV